MNALTRCFRQTPLPSDDAGDGAERRLDRVVGRHRPVEEYRLVLWSKPRAKLDQAVG
jgi:hypothetical protein